MSLELFEAIELHKPFLDNKYTRWYMELVSKECDDEYTEKYHILPRSMFPQYVKSKWNIVRLSGRKHFIAHMLLYKMVNKKSLEYGKMLTAAVRMKSFDDKKYVNSYLYETARVGYSNYLKGKPVSEETRRKLSITVKGRINGPMKEDAKQRMIATKKRNHVPKIWMNKDGIQTKVVYEQIDKYLSEGWKKGTHGKYINEDWRNKMKISAIQQWKTVKSLGYKNLVKES